MFELYNIEWYIIEDGAAVEDTRGLALNRPSVLAVSVDDAHDWCDEQADNFYPHLDNPTITVLWSLTRVKS